MKKNEKETTNLYRISIIINSLFSKMICLEKTIHYFNKKEIKMPLLYSLCYLNDQSKST